MLNKSKVHQTLKFALVLFQPGSGSQLVNNFDLGPLCNLEVVAVDRPLSISLISGVKWEYRVRTNDVFKFDFKLH